MLNENAIKDMKIEDLKDIQAKGLEMLIYFKKICDENHLTFFLCGGCCIGTIRHGGFIPWDDDVDVFMKREDYEKLKAIWNDVADTDKYEIVFPTENLHTRNLFATINDNNTTFIKTHQKDLDINHGLVLDILPLDGCPSSKIKRKKQIFWALVYSIFCAQMVPTNHGKFVNMLGKGILAAFPSKKLRYKIYKFAEKQMTKYNIDKCEKITELCSGPVYMMNEYPKELFKNAVYKQFEGYSMPMPVGYDKYLKMVFGDYMRMPPKDKQVPHHDAVFFDMNNSYKKYKGKYYNKGEL